MKKLFILAVLTCALACQNAQNPESQTEQNQEQNSEEQIAQVEKISLKDLKANSLFQCVEDNSVYLYYVGQSEASYEFEVKYAEDFENLSYNYSEIRMIGKLNDDKFVLKHRFEFNDDGNEFTIEQNGNNLVFAAKKQFEAQFKYLEKYTFKKVEESKFADKFDATALINKGKGWTNPEKTIELYFSEQLVKIDGFFRTECAELSFKTKHLGGDNYHIMFTSVVDFCSDGAYDPELEDVLSTIEQDVTIKVAAGKLTMKFSKDACDWLKGEMVFEAAE